MSTHYPTHTIEVNCNSYDTVSVSAWDYVSGDTGTATVYATAGTRLLVPINQRSTTDYTIYTGEQGPSMGIYCDTTNRSNGGKDVYYRDNWGRYSGQGTASTGPDLVMGSTFYGVMLPVRLYGGNYALLSLYVRESNMNRLAFEQTLSATSMGIAVCTSGFEIAMMNPSYIRDHAVHPLRALQRDWYTKCFLVPYAPEDSTYDALRLSNFPQVGTVGGSPVYCYTTDETLADKIGFYSFYGRVAQSNPPDRNFYLYISGETSVSVPFTLLGPTGTLWSGTVVLNTAYTLSQNHAVYTGRYKATYSHALYETSKFLPNPQQVYSASHQFIYDYYVGTPITWYNIVPQPGIGIASIGLYDNGGGPITRASPGVEVQVRVELTDEAKAQGATISSKSVYYADIYDDTTIVPLTVYTDTGFSFTMPPATVYVKVTATFDPNDIGGTSGPGGGDGDYDNRTDDIPVPDMPLLDGQSTGLFTLYCPTKEQLIRVSDFLYTSISSDGVFSAIWEALGKIYADPMSMLIALNIVPFRPSATTTQVFHLGNWLSADFDMPLCDNQFWEVDCGTVEFSEYWGSALDYNPYTKIELYLPYAGTVFLNPDEVMNKTVGIKYRIDVLTGTGTAIVTANGNVIYQHNCNCAVSIPLTSQNHINLARQLISLVGVGVGAYALGSAFIAGQKAYSTAVAAGSQAAGIPISPAAPSAIGVDAAFSQSPVEAVYHTAAQAERSAARDALVSSAKSAWNGLPAYGKAIALNQVANTVGSVIGGKASVERSGSMGSYSGYLGVQYPYATITRPNQSLAKDYKHYVGYPSNQTLQIGLCSGYTRFETINITDIPATDPEIGELYDILKGGFYA